MEDISIGTNRTGMKVSPLHAKELLETVNLDTVTNEPMTGSDGLGTVRSEYIADADPLGSIPPPSSIVDAVKTVAKQVMGDDPKLLIDKLGERLAYERGGTRLYDGLLTKLRTAETLPSDLDEAALLQIRDEEASHFALLAACLEKLGGDPTAQTPGATLVGIETMGFLQAMSDPRTTFVQSLHVTLAAELIDVAAWEMLAELASQQGQDDMAQEFQRCLEAENRHLARVRTWYRELTFDDQEL